MNRRISWKTGLQYCLLLTISVTGLALATPMLEPPKEPPPQAYVACVGKKAGDAVIMATADSRQIQAVCQVVNNRLAARPVIPPPEQTGEQR